MKDSILAGAMALSVVATAACALEQDVQPDERGQAQESGLDTAGVTLKFQEWEVPGGVETFPHDPTFAPDGSGWYTGYMANVLGRVDAVTGDITEFTLPTENSGPHGLVADGQGHIWYTGHRVSLIGQLDPQTGDVVEYPMPDPAVSDPHTPIFDQKGVLWFTAQNANYVGKLDPASGEVTVKELATADAMPHGIDVSQSGIPFFDMSGTNKIGRIDPETMEITEYVLPEGARPRRIAVTDDDTVWYTDLARGLLGRLDAATGQVEEFPSPGGSKSEPYGIAATSDGVIWYSESGVQPNTLVRFDPETESMHAWPLPSSESTVRHMVAAPDDTLWLACSGSGTIVHVRINHN